MPVKRTYANPVIRSGRNAWVVIAKTHCATLVYRALAPRAEREGEFVFLSVIHAYGGFAVTAGPVGMKTFPYREKSRG